MRALNRWALMAMILFAAVGLPIALLTAGQPPLLVFISYLMLSFFAVGILFGNLNSLAMEPLGHIAGIGAAIVGSFSTLVTVFIGTIIGQSYNGTVTPLIVSLGVLGVLSVASSYWADSQT